MATTNGAVDTQQVHIGWQAIAAALGVSKATARRWTKQFGLPVYKLGGQVRADKVELKQKMQEVKKVWAKTT